MRIVPADEALEEFEVQGQSEQRAAQGWLFPPDELWLPQAFETYRKPVVAIHAIPERRDISMKLSARKLMEALPLAVQLDLRARGEAEREELVRKIREDRATPLFEIRTTELVRLAGLNQSNLDRIHETLAEMVGLRFTWNVLGEDHVIEYEAVAPFLIRRDKGVGRKVGYTRFAFEPEILLWFLEPRLWAKLSWTVMSGIGRKDGPGQEAAFGLYQTLWRYLSTPNKMTRSFDIANFIDLVIGPSRYVKVDLNGKKDVVDYGDFKRRHLLPGLAILNAHPALTHTAKLHEVKANRKVTRVRFTFTEKRQGSFELPLGWPPASIKYLEGIGYTDRDINELSQVYLYEQIAEALRRFPVAEQRVRDKGSKVYSRKAFFAGILANVAKGEQPSAEEDDRLLRQAERRHQQEAEEQRMRALQAKFSEHQRSLITEALQTLAAAERDALIQAHLAANPQDRVMYKAGELTKAYLVLFCAWLESARPELYSAWLPESKDHNFQSWLAWQLMQR